MHAWAQELKAKTAAGAMLFFDGELWPDPRWNISKHEISFTSGNCTQMILERGHDPEEAEMRTRLRVLVDAP